MGADRKRYICITPCWHLGARYFRGDEGMFADDELPRTKGVIRHFELVMPGKAVPVAADPVVVVNSKKKK